MLAYEGTEKGVVVNIKTEIYMLSSVDTEERK